VLPKKSKLCYQKDLKKFTSERKTMKEKSSVGNYECRLTFYGGIEQKIPRDRKLKKNRDGLALIILFFHT
jgi:hypothetical protein